MRLFHGTSREALPSIQQHGIRRSEHEEWGSTVCALDSLEKAKDVAAYFGKDGIVIEFEAPDTAIQYHPDYGQSSEFDTIHVNVDIPPTSIIKVIDTPSRLESPRPSNMPLRQWKQQEMEKDPDWHSKLDKALGTDPKL